MRQFLRDRNFESGKNDDCQLSLIVGFTQSVSEVYLNQILTETNMAVNVSKMYLLKEGLLFRYYKVKGCPKDVITSKSLSIQFEFELCLNKSRIKHSALHKNIKNEGQLITN